MNELGHTQLWLVHELAQLTLILSTRSQLNTPCCFFFMSEAEIGEVLHLKNSIKTLPLNEQPDVDLSGAPVRIC